MDPYAWTQELKQAWIEPSYFLEVPWIEAKCVLWIVPRKKKLGNFVFFAYKFL